MVHSAVLAACSTDGRGSEPRTSTNACGHACRYVDRKGLAAMLTSGESQELIVRRQQSTPSEGSTLAKGTRYQKSKTGVSVAPRKRTYVLQKCIKKVPLILKTMMKVQTLLNPQEFIIG